MSKTDKKTYTEGEVNNYLRMAVRDPMNFIRHAVSHEKNLLAAVPEAKDGVTPLQNLTPDECKHLADALESLAKATKNWSNQKRTTHATVVNMTKDVEAVVADLRGLANGTLRPVTGKARKDAEKALAEKLAAAQEAAAEAAKLQAMLDL